MTMKLTPGIASAFDKVRENRKRTQAKARGKIVEI